MAKLLVNGRFTLQKTTGVQRYAIEVTRRLGALDYEILKPTHGPSTIGGHMWEQLYLPRKVGKLDTLWSPCGIGPVDVRNHVVTIHDLAHIEHPEWYSRSFSTWYRFILPRLLASTKHVITVSEFTKDRLIHHFKLSPDSVTAIPLGVDETFFHSSDVVAHDVRRKFGIHSRFFIAVGLSSPRKNLETLLKAWSLFQRENFDAHLVLVGTKQDTFSRKSAPITEGDVNRVLSIGYVSDSELKALYYESEALVYPSLYEGFGLPILEAMAAGSRVIASNVTAIPETVRDHGTLVNPLDPEAIAEAMLEIMKRGDSEVDKEKRKAYISKYTWEATANTTAKLLSSVL